jgi:glycosyltransferase involved in cell wall biosynthesis
LAPAPVHITHLITSLGGGGTENFLFQILSGSPASYEHDVLYLGKDGVNGERIRRLGVPVQRINPGYALYRRLKEKPPHVLHTCLYWAHQVGRVIGRMAKVPRIVSSHQSIDVWQKPWHGWIDRLTLPLCDVVDVNSDAARQVLEKRLGNTSKKPRFVKVENGVDFRLFKPIEKASARQSLGVGADARIAGTLMRLHAEKGAEKIPAFARKLLNADPRLVLVIGGSGPLESRIKDETRDLGDRIRWMGWQEDTVRFLSALDFFWLLSREESFPQALLEASAMGLPWIAPHVGGIHELLDAGASGILSASNSAEAMTEAGKTMLMELAALTEKARRVVPAFQARYGVETMAQAFYRIAGENNL